MQRGNVAGVLLDVFEYKPSDDMGATSAMGEELSDRVKKLSVEQLEALAHVGDWSPKLDLAAAARAAGAESDSQIVDWALSAWLSSEPSPGLRELLVKHLASERQAAGLDSTPLAEAGAKGERVLRRLAHLIFSLPEAQLG
jgi:hypothetical protein